MTINSLGTGAVWTPTAVPVIHFGSPAGSNYEEEKTDD